MYNKKFHLVFILLIFFSLKVTAFSSENIVSKRIYIQDSSYSVIAYIEPDGTVYNNDNKIIGYLNSDGSILNSSYTGIGSIEPDGRILNRSYSQIAYFYTDGSLLDNSYNPIAYIKSGYVSGPSHNRILSFDTLIDKKWIAVFFIFFY